MCRYLDVQIRGCANVQIEGEVIDVLMYGF